MRLPTKTEVEKERVLERQQEVKEGLNIAKKVDAVRLELITEQNNLEKFRKETTVRIQKEIDELFQKRQLLSFENDVLERHNSNLKSPFDSEWESIRKTRLDELDTRMGAIERTHVSVEEEKARIAVVSAQTAKDSEEARLAKEEASRERLEAQNELHQAAEVAENEKIRVAEHQSRIDAENNQLSKKEEELAVKLRDIQVRETAIQSSVKELARRELYVKEKYEDEIKGNLESLKKANEDIEKDKSEIVLLRSKISKESQALSEKLLEVSQDKFSAKEAKEIAGTLLKEARLKKEELMVKVAGDSEYLNKKLEGFSTREAKIQFQEKVIKDTLKSLKSQESAVLSQKEKLANKVKAIDALTIQLEQNTAESERSLSESEKVKKSIDAQLKEASRERESAKKEAEKALKMSENAIILKEKSLEKSKSEQLQLSKKEEELALMLRDIQVREASIKKSAMQLDRREKFINSKYKALLNAQKELQ